jgi:thioredoxin reductase
VGREAYRYVIVGGGLAAASAAEGIREMDPSGSVILIGQETRPPYHRPPVSKGILLGSKRPEDTACKAEAFYRDNRIVLETGVSGTGMDPAGRTVTLGDGRVVSYERLLLATGSRARRLRLPGADLKGIYTLRTLDDALTLVEAMKGANTAVVIGGSYIGAESASALAQHGIRTTILFPEDRLLQALTDEELGRYLHSLYEKNLVSILTRRKPTRFNGQGHVTSVSTDQGEELPADLVVMGVGAELNTDRASTAVSGPMPFCSPARSTSSSQATLPSTRTRHSRNGFAWSIGRPRSCKAKRREETWQGPESHTEACPTTSPPCSSADSPYGEISRTGIKPCSRGRWAAPAHRSSTCSQGDWSAPSSSSRWKKKRRR